MFENYEKYLAFLNNKLEKFFNEQAPYIFCKKGCSKCCRNAEFPYSELEAKYLYEGFKKLDSSTQTVINNNIERIKNEKAVFNGAKFLYTCPFLINDVCSLYNYRGIVCRTFGLIANTNSENAKLPFCHSEGLNYSNVVDMEKNQITQEKFLQSGFKTEPLGYNVSYDFLTSPKTENVFNIKFGDKKPLIDWFL
jgi:Fe-S-cluster containining protein